MKKIILLSTIILLILLGFLLVNSIKIPAPIKEKVYDIPIDQFT